MTKKLTEIFPKDLFVQPKTGLRFAQEPLKDKILQMEKAKSPEVLGRALSNDYTRLFFETLWFKVHQKPPENITLEIKGQTRSGKSSVGIFLFVWLSRMWGYEPKIDNILANQSELLYKIRNAKFGETFLVDEQTHESYSEGVIAETEQIGMNLNICAKKCNNIIFIYPPRFTLRGAAYGLETVGKDVANKWNKCFLYDLGDRRMMGFSMFPFGYVTIPKYIEKSYVNIPMEKWSKRRLANYRETGNDFDSLLEEQYELDLKDKWIEDVRSLSGSKRNKIKEEYAKKLSENDSFNQLKKGEKIAYIQLKINRGEFIELSRSEIESLANMAVVIYNESE